jgi:hypothetical protein
VDEDPRQMWGGLNQSAVALRARMFPGSSAVLQRSGKKPFSSLLKESGLKLSKAVVSQTGPDCALFCGLLIQRGTRDCA